MKQKVLGEQWNTRMLTKAGNTRSSDEKQKAASLWILSMTVGIMGIKHSINALSLCGLKSWLPRNSIKQFKNQQIYLNKTLKKSILILSNNVDLKSSLWEKKTHKGVNRILTIMKVSISLTLTMCLRGKLLIIRAVSINYLGLWIFCPKFLIFYKE